MAFRRPERNRFYLLAKVIIGVLFCMALWVGSSLLGLDLIPEGTSLKSGVPSGRIETTIQSFHFSPFLVDTNLSKAAEVILYKRSGLSAKGPGNMTHRVYTPGPISFTIKASMPRLQGNIPRVWVYDESGQLIQAASYQPDVKHPVFSVNLPKAGLYQIRVQFRYEGLDELLLQSDATPAQIPYKQFVLENRKNLQLRVSTGQLDLLNNLLERGKRIWSEPKPEDVQWPQYEGVNGRVTGQMKVGNGKWASVTIGLSGRSNVHIPKNQFPLPSLDVKILAGPLPYGLKRFKLYTLPSKRHATDFVYESLLGDQGLLMPRSDIVQISLNGHNIGNMVLLEGIDTHFFEGAQRAEDKLVGYDADKLVARFYNNYFESRGYYRTKTYQKIKAPELASLQFAESICNVPMQLAISYAFTHAGNHGLGQADLRFHLNRRLGCYDPIVRDFDHGVYQIRHGSFINAWLYLSQFASHWQPYAVTVGSYYMLRDDSEQSRKPVFLWSTMPATLNFLASPKNLEQIAAFNDMWSSSWSRMRIESRMRNTAEAIEIVSPDLARKFNLLSKNLVYSQDSLAGKIKKIDIEDGASDYAYRIGENIEDLTAGRVSPQKWDLGALYRRNESIKLAGLSDGTLAAEYIKENSPEKILTFLYRSEEDGNSHVILIERAPGADPVNVVLRGKNGEVFQPRAVKEYGNLKRTIRIYDVLLNLLQPEEFIRLYWFKVPRAAYYRYLIPDIEGIGSALTPREMVISPKTDVQKDYAVSTESDSPFRIDGNVLSIIPSNLIITNELVIPFDKIWRVDQDLVLKFSGDGCLTIFGELEVAKNSRLRLVGDGAAGWSGIHIHGGDQRRMQNITLKNIGHNEKMVKCGKRYYTGGISFFNTRAALQDIQIEGGTAEDSLHIFRSEVEINSMFIKNSRSDAIDLDYSVVTMDGVEVQNSYGDGIDASGSLLSISNSKIENSKDKSLSIGENTRAKVVSSSFLNGEFGIAVKDGSWLEISESIIKQNRYGIASYSKKPFYPFPKVTVGSNVTYRNNQYNVKKLEVVPTASE